jgi:hypothetical protein
MKKNFLLSMLAMLAFAVTFVACSDDDDVPTVKESTLVLETPMNLKEVALSNLNMTITNVKTKKTFTFNGDQFVQDGNDFSLALNNMEEGTYNVSATGHLDFELNGVAGQKDFDVKSDGVTLSRQNPNMKISVSSFTAQGGFVISEIFFTGTTTPEEEQYGNDQYMIITNNSDVTLYADSIAVLESEFMTVDKQEYTPDIMSEAFSVDAVYMIPGNGKEVAVEPGKSLVLAINAINHTEANANSFDLSGADYEFFDESSNPSFTDTDGPAKNLDKWYCYTASVYGFHNRGFHSYAIAKMKETKENWLENYAYTASYTWTFQEWTFDQTTDTFKVPNSWILDGVNLCVETEWQWNVLDASIDKSWTYCGKEDKDKTRYNKSVIRKMDAKGKYIDTNDSANDFEPEAVPSFLR